MFLVLDTHLTDITQKLLMRFSSGEGYEAFDDAIAISELLSLKNSQYCPENGDVSHSFQFVVFKIRCVLKQPLSAMVTVEFVSRIQFTKAILSALRNARYRPNGFGIPKFS